MSVVTKLVRTEEFAREVSGCPLASPGDRATENTCGACKYNLAFSGQPKVGCVLHTPVKIVDSAIAGLKKRAPMLYERFERLRKSISARNPPAPTVPRQWLSLARTWYDAAKNDPEAAAEREVAVVIARFAEGAINQGEGVEILN
jgi:hypothetical protein